MNALKKLIALKPKIEEPPVEAIKETQYIEPKTYYDDGTKKCIDASGSPSILKNCLIEVFEKFKEESRLTSAEQERLKKPIIQEQQRQKSELAKRTLLKEMKEKAFEDLSNQIKKIDQDIAEVPENPNKFGIDADKKPKAQFYIGVLILLPITLYLLVFYISASYSAFFKDFSPDTTIFAAIFDGQALSKAYNDPNGGLLEVIFICTIPFAFMGLGYLVHMFQKAKGKATMKIVSLFVITFIFDAILAYQIEKKIFDFEKLPGEVFNLSLAFQSVEFWGIIFAGFVVYVIWGLVFDFIMNEYENIDNIKIFINSLKNQKENLLAQKEETKKLKETIEEDISGIEGKIRELQFQVDGFIFEKKRYLIYHSQYLNGWLLAIGREIALPREQKEKLIQECISVSDEHLKIYNVSSEDREIVIYT
jgi:HD-GYP domain-containing protein (c-di-GMP phosphodiesterase class II)